LRRVIPRELRPTQGRDGAGLEADCWHSLEVSANRATEGNSGRGPVKGLDRPVTSFRNPQQYHSLETHLNLLRVR
jgi:hypothetical protein